MMTGVNFRRATVADLADIVAMLADDELGRLREDPGEPLAAGYLAAFEAIAADPNQLLAVAESDGAVVGCLQITFLPGLSSKGAWRGQIESVRVASGRRGEQIGRRMVSWAIERCREKGCATVQLATDKRRTRAHRFYEGLGFVASHEGMKLKLQGVVPVA